MPHKEMRNKLKLFASMLVCAIAIVATPVTTLISFAAETTEVTPCADIIEYVYKIEDGKLYEALFNRSTGQYVTDWTYVCEWPPEE